MMLVPSKQYLLWVASGAVVYTVVVRTLEVAGAPLWVGVLVGVLLGALGDVYMDWLLEWKRAEQEVKSDV